MKSACRSPVKQGGPPTATAGPARDLRRAFTLFEILIVLSLMVVVIGLLWPSLSRMVAYTQLRQGAERVGTRLASARVHAIETGLAYQFRYEPGGRRFLVVPFDQEIVAASSPSAGSTGADPSNGGGGRRATRTVGMLPAAISFEGGQMLGDKGTGIPDEWLSGLPDSAEYSGVLWSGPVLFHPDGTTAPFELVLQNKKNEQVKVTVRGLTGGVKVSKVE
ncbi:MAG: hypothetical protein EXS05_20425 [Planctomycetaceae bacterium]|nr:hypothetical protein [Planctomycetaceae bacterium]